MFENLPRKFLNSIRYKSEVSLQKFLKKHNIFIHKSEKSRDSHSIDYIRKQLILSCKGVLHIGAHYGQEASFYSDLGASVMWVEAMPEKYTVLCKKLSEFPNQKVMCALLGSANKNKIRFNVSSNDGASSSIYSFGDNTQFKNLEMVRSVFLKMKRLDSCFSIKDISAYPHWVIDVQGAELEVLKGAGDLLRYCHSLEIEVTSRNLYLGGANAQDVINFLNLNGFIALQKHKIGLHEDLIFIRGARCH